MNIFHKVALQGLLKNRTRTLVTIIGVILSTAMFTAVATFGSSLMDYLVRVEITQNGNWHVQFSGVDFNNMQEWRREQEVIETASYQNIGYAILEGAGEASADKPYLFIAGFDEEAFAALPINLISGRLPENDNEVIVPEHIMIKAGVKIPLGTDLSLAVGQRTSNGVILTQCNPYIEDENLINMAETVYTVVGTYERPGFEVHSSPGYTLITRTCKEETESYSLFVALDNPRHIYTYVESKKSVSAYELNDNLLRFMGITDNKLFNALLYTIGGVIAAIIMTGSFFLIYNSFHISLGERVHQFGIFMSVGATAKQLRGMVLFEGICIGMVGIPFGILAGIGSTRVLLAIVAKNFYGMISASAPLTLAVSFPALAASAIISLITILISAYIPAKKAAAMPVMECIRQTNEIKTEAKSVRTSQFSWNLYGLEGILALKNFKRNKKRYRSVVLSLTLSVVLAVSGAAFGTTLKRISKELLSEAADGDISFMTQDMPEEEFIRLYEKLNSIDGVERSTWQADAFYTAMTDEMPEDFLMAYRSAMNDETTGLMQQMILYTQFIEDEIYDEFVQSLGLALEEYRGEDAKVFICGMNSENHTTYFAGSSMNFTLTSSSGEQSKTICATFEDSYPLDTAFVLEDVPPYVFVMTAPLSMKSQFDGLETVDDLIHLGALFWSETPSQTMAQIQDMIMTEGVLTDYTLLNLSTAFGMFRNLNFVVDLFTYVFVFMISLIAVANVFNTISTNIRLRRRELAMLRSVGMSDRGFNRMMNFECIFYGMRTLLYGIPISVLASWLIYKGLTAIEKLDDMAFAFPWSAMIISILGVFGIVFITMLYAAGKIRKENIIDALRDEMT